MTTKSIVLDVQMMLEVLTPLPAIAARKIMSACSTKQSTYPYPNQIHSACMEKTALILNNVTDRKRPDPTVHCNNIHGKKYTRS